MAAKRAAPPAGQADGQAPNWTTRECAAYLRVSRQKWTRICSEMGIVGDEDEHGVLRYNPDVVIDLADKMGLGPSDDANTVALTVLRESLEAMGEYVKQLQSHSVSVLNVLREENNSIRTMREKEQAAYLASVIATQEALDLSAERKLVLEQARASSERLEMGTKFLLNTIVPKIMAQWREGQHGAKLVDLLKTLAPEHVTMLKELFPAHAEHIDAILQTEEKQRVEGFATTEESQGGDGTASTKLPTDRPSPEQGGAPRSE